MNKLRSIFLSLFLIISLTLSGCSSKNNQQNVNPTTIEQKNDFEKESEQKFDANSIPEYSGQPFAVVNNNVPFFTPKDLTKTSFEYYSDLDSLGRCGVAFANIGKDIMPTEKRGNISSVKPSGWYSIKYEKIDGFQLSAENANEKNLITGTRYLNVTGMLPFENMVADYVKETNNHVLYRVTPVFRDDNLIADGVLMEAKSVEDDGEGILFNVFVYNVQPGITINYKTGESHLTNAESEKITEATDNDKTNNSLQTQNENAKSNLKYILNTNSKKVHKPNCRTLKNLSLSNKSESSQQLSQIKSMGYVPCKVCNPS